MGIISWIVVGLIARLLAKVLLPGDDPGGLIITTIIGMAGAVVGDVLIGVLGGAVATGFNVWSILVVTLGAVVLLFVYRQITGSRRTF